MLHDRRVSTLVLFLILEGMLSVFPHWECLLRACHMWHLQCWGRFVPSMPIFWRVLIINGCWILSKAFSASIEIIIWFLSYNFLIWCITLIDLHILKNPCIPGINLTWSWYMSFWCVAEFCAKILVRIFASMFISDIGLLFSFFVFVWFRYQDYGGLIEWFWKCSFLCNFLKEF